jgi:hypothetical protein
MKMSYIFSRSFMKGVTSVSNSEDLNATSESEENDTGLAHTLLRKDCCRGCRDFLLGVVLPMFGLIFLSGFLGYGISLLESPAEFDANDLLIRSQLLFYLSFALHANSTAMIPGICLEMYSINMSIEDVLINVPPQPGNDTDIFIFQSEMYAWLLNTKSDLDAMTSAAGFATEVSMVNYTYLGIFLDLCNRELRPSYDSTKNLAESMASSEWGDSMYQDLTIHWSRCPSKNYTSSWVHLLLARSDFLASLSPVSTCMDCILYTQAVALVLNTLLRTRIRNLGNTRKSGS